jgi:hypothetical protein
MLGMKTYTRDYIAACRARVDADLAAYRKLAAAAKKQPAGDKKLSSAIEAFESTFFNNMVLVLDEMFVHRLRTVEGKDGNALYEVRVLCNSILNNNNIMTADNVGAMTAFAGLNTIKLSPTNSVLKYQVGDEIKLTEADFAALSRAFFAEIERKYL